MKKYYTAPYTFLTARKFYDNHIDLTNKIPCQPKQTNRKVGTYNENPRFSLWVCRKEEIYNEKHTTIIYHQDILIISMYQGNNYTLLETILIFKKHSFFCVPPHTK